MGNPDDLLTTSEVIGIYKVSRMTVRRWARSGHLPAVKVGSRYRFRREDVEALAQPVEPEPKAG